MNSSLERLKRQITDFHRQAGQRAYVRVDYRTLMQVLDDYERLDAHMRSISMMEYGSPAARLDSAIREIYQNEARTSDVTMLVVMDAIRPFIEENEKRRMFEWRTGKHG